MPYKDYEKQKENARKNYYANREKKLAQAKAYYYENWEAKQEYRANWIDSNQAKFRASKAKYSLKRNTDPTTKQKTRAYNKVRWALKKGTLVRAEHCDKCHKNTRIHAHHHKEYSDDFALDVQWLCVKCHKGEHIDVRQNIKIYARA